MKPTRTLRNCGFRNMAHERKLGEKTKVTEQ